jgi:cytosine/adenosine deaminase-related metal-dependent hydrolase
MKILIENCSILDETAAWGRTERQYLLIDGQRIKSITATRPEETFDRVIDGRRFLVIPGLVNAHTHSPENLVKATDNRMPLEPWLVHLVWASGEFDARAHYLAAMVGAIEMLQSGTTAVLDHLSLDPTVNLPGMNATMEAYRDSGIRAGVAPMSSTMSLDTEDGERRGHGLKQTIFARSHDRQAVGDLLGVQEEFFKTWHGADGGRLRCWTGPSGVQWSTMEYLHQCLDLSNRYGAGLHMHLMESRVQDHVTRDAFGQTSVARLAQEKLLAPNVSLPHSVWLTDRDVERLAATGAVPVHNPAANLRLGSGLAPIRKMLDAGVLPALGADGSKSSDHQNMFGHLHLAALIHNLTFLNPDRWIASREAVRMVTEGGAAALLLTGQLGKVAPGWLADLVLLDLDSPSLTPFNDAFHHLAFTELGQSVHTVIVDGKIVVENGKITLFDAPAILEQARNFAAERVHRGPLPDEWRDAIDRYRSYQQDIVHNTTFRQD